LNGRKGPLCRCHFQMGSFDLAISQQGLQFMPDRNKALREMNRVLVNGSSNRRDKHSSYGRLVLSVWTSINDSPGISILQRLLRETISHEAATILQLPHSLTDISELVSLAGTAGFNKILSKK
jgi:ubiquinone/menaquinone biosynthesis C-methylase UbiE